MISVSGVLGQLDHYGVLRPMRNQVKAGNQRLALVRRDIADVGVLMSTDDGVKLDRPDITIWQLAWKG